MAAKVGDIDDEDNIMTTKIKLTHNEYNATIRNKLEFNRLKVIVKHINEQSDSASSKRRTMAHDLKKWLNDNQTIVCNTEEFFFNRQLNLSSPRRNRQRPVGINSGFARPNRVQSAGSGLLNRPSTAPIKIYHGELSDDDTSDDEIIPIHIQSTTPNSRLTSAMRSTTTELSNYPPSISQQDYEDNKSSAAYSSTRISWPVKLRVFALQDEDEARKQWLAWKAEQRKAKRRSSKQFLDVELERQYRESIRRRQEIEAFLTPEIIENAKLHDPIFAKRYRQLKLAVKAGKLPAYDRNDTEINVTMTKSKIERARTALISAKQSKIKSIYRNQQIINDKNLSRRIDYFLTSLENLKKELGESV